MKRNRLLLLAAILCSSTTLLNAQSTLDEQSGGSKQQPSEAPKQKSEIKKNIVKVNLMALGLKNYSFQYERVLTKHISVALGVRTMPTGSLPLKSTIIDLVDSNHWRISKGICNCVKCCHDSPWLILKRFGIKFVN